RHLAGRAFSVVVHGDAAGAENLRRSLSDWLGDMGLIAAGHQAEIDRYVGYYEPYADSHHALDADRAFQEETRNAARALMAAVKLLRRGKLSQPDAKIREPRPK
ncbi:MAG: NADPH-dependent FMN reductase, partial [Planctomycetota bacterium]